MAQFPNTFSESSGQTRLEEFFERWNHKEITYVHMAARITRRASLKRFFTMVSMLSDGWLYVGIVLLILFTQGWSAWPVLVCGGISAAICHGIYPLIKKRLERIRPCHFDPELDSCVKVLDEYSCPSGHVMTAVAVGFPLAFYFPELTGVIAVTCLLIAFSRVALGHHYPSDLLLGALLASAITLPISIPLI